MLEVKNAQVVIREGFWMQPKTILDDIQFQISETGVYGILGPNGAGKTTLIQLLVGLFSPTQGQVLLNGRPTISTQARAQMGFLPERPYFYQHLTGKNFLSLMGHLTGMTSNRLKTRIPEVLEWVGLRNTENLELSGFSKGMLQRMGIAQAIIHDPEWIILDEPMSGLDSSGRKEIRELIRSLGASRKKLLFSSHVLSDLEELAREVLILQKGKLIGQKKILDLMTESEQVYELIFQKKSGDKEVIEATTLEAAHRLIEARLQEKQTLHRMGPKVSVLEKWLESDAKDLK